MEEKTLHLSVRVPESVIREIDHMAVKDDRDRSYIVNRIFREATGKKKK